MEESHIFSQKRYRERPTSFSNVVGVCREDHIGLLTVPQALWRTPADSAYRGVGSASSPFSPWGSIVVVRRGDLLKRHRGRVLRVLALRLFRFPTFSLPFLLWW